jgi:nicotinate-nucleotide--dimethylbenzimidazole phosphoribosyltransferase
MSADLDATILKIEPRDQEIERAARCAFDRKTKPRGSLGRLEELACRIAGIRRELAPSPGEATVVVVASDHGVAARGVSAYPQEVTAQMLRTFASGGAAIRVLTQRAGAGLVVVDAGVRGGHSIAGVRSLRFGDGTFDMTRGPAMDRRTARRAVEAGISLAGELTEGGCVLLALGDGDRQHDVGECSDRSAARPRPAGRVRSGNGRER